jgi:hypothetical protein
MDFAPSLIMAGNPGMDRAGKMAATSGFGPQAQQSIKVVSEMLREFRYGEACVFLFHLNKWHTEEWSYVRDEILKTVEPSRISMVSTIMECSTKSELSACNLLVPGLAQYVRPNTSQELLD